MSNNINANSIPREIGESYNDYTSIPREIGEERSATNDTLRNELKHSVKIW